MNFLCTRKLKHVFSQTVRLKSGNRPGKRHTNTNPTVNPFRVPWLHLSHAGIKTFVGHESVYPDDDIGRGELQPTSGAIELGRTRCCGALEEGAW